MKLLQQQMNPHARAIDALGQELRWQRRGHGSRLIPTVTSPAVTLAANHSTIDDRFDLDLFAGVALTERFQRQATAGTDFGGLRQVDLLFASRQVRVVSS